MLLEEERPSKSLYDLYDKEFWDERFIDLYSSCRHCLGTTINAIPLSELGIKD
jgi:hypothetical protein